MYSIYHDTKSGTYIILSDNGQRSGFSSSVYNALNTLGDKSNEPLMNAYLLDYVTLYGYILIATVPDLNNLDINHPELFV